MSGMFTLPASAASAVRDEVARYGSIPVESGGFLLGPGDDPRVDVVAFARDLGVRRARDLFVINGSALDRLFNWAHDRDARVYAQFHSHRTKAFLSRTDLNHGFSVKGFVTAVVPNYAAPAALPSMWGWWTYTGEAWETAVPPEVTSGDVAVVQFDASGVYES